MELSKQRPCRSGKHLFTGKKCKECHRDWLAANKQRLTEYFREYRAKDPEKWREVQRKWAAQNPGRKAASGRKWRSANAEKERARARQQYYANRDTEQFKETRRLQEQRRRARKAAVLAELTEAQWDAILAWHSSPEGTRCAYCFNLCKPTVDHVVPIAQGGNHTAENVVPACGPCNSSKGVKEVRSWL